MSFKPIKVVNSRFVIQPTFLTFPNAFGIGFGAKTPDKDDPWEIEELKIVVMASVSNPSNSRSSNDPASNRPASNRPGSPEPPAVFIYRMRRPFDQSTIRVKIFGEAPDGVSESMLHGHKCLRATSEVTGDVVNYLLVDDRTVVVVVEKDVACVLAADPKGHPAWYKHWQEVDQSPIAFWADSAAMKAALDAPENDPNESADHAEKLFESILKETALLFGHVDSTAAGLEFSATAHCDSSEKTVATNKLVQGLVEICFKMLPELVDPALLPKEYQSLDIGGALGKALATLATTTNVETKQVRWETKIDADFVSRFIAATEVLLARQTEEFKAAVERDQQAHFANLCRLIEALNAYHTAHGHYPPAAVIGPDGKTAHSWRVELLPLLGEQKLYDSYKLDEPWDSEHNKQLIEKIPSVYGTTKSSTKGDADYFVVTGTGTLFDGNAAPKRESITDAVGETILLVQSRRQIPWTKPADIDTSAADSPFRPGRTRRNDFYAAFADGSVKLVPKNTDPATIQALFTKAAGDEVKLR
jgi:hypothetical protein